MHAENGAGIAAPQIGSRVRFRVTVRVTGYRLRVTGYGLRVTGYGLRLALLFGHEASELKPYRSS